MADDDEIILSELSDDELVLQMHDDLYDGLKEEIEEGVNILIARGWAPYDVLTKALVAGMTRWVVRPELVTPTTVGKLCAGDSETGGGAVSMGAGVLSVAHPVRQSATVNARASANLGAMRRA